MHYNHPLQVVVHANGRRQPGTLTADIRGKLGSDAYLTTKDYGEATALSARVGALLLTTVAYVSQVKTCNTYCNNCGQKTGGSQCCRSTMIQPVAWFWAGGAG